ncbi:HPr(Ser) kinase/phosphatase [Candidatus Mycoplasma haematominutum]|uniref:HPr kinase/phosphorylase n=1 Tax=Candidatus Mycoplasma haematominutum 'Birmingham 1' TaxID=1116213 RepID=G8C3X8_9MOLU|nr:HPr(Ser) kinase/phosphatase [Candidatus Mycoplasma haematominutum]CCE67026.1 HPr kinase/phosphorylase [Candidatus Mycoplasma haematominutum 'Birmingham 1']
MKEVKVTVFSIFKRFGGKFVNKSPETCSRVIKESALSRLGMELSGAFPNQSINSAVVWGERECQFFHFLDEKKKRTSIKNIVLKNPPLFLLSKNFTETDLLISLNKEFNNNQSAIIQFDYSTQDIFSSVGAWLSKTLASWTTIHGSVVSIFGEGVLLIGEPGIGKTEVILDLLSLNHLFLGDDAINITRLGNAVIARANTHTSEFIQIRGIGIINIKEAIGRSKIIDETKIHIIIELKHHKNFKPEEPLENWGEDIRYKELLSIQIPYYILPVQAGRNISELIQACVNDHKLKKAGYNSAVAFDKKVKASLQKPS